MTLHFRGEAWSPSDWLIQGQRLFRYGLGVMTQTPSSPRWFPWWPHHSQVCSLGLLLWHHVDGAALNSLLKKSFGLITQPLDWMSPHGETEELQLRGAPHHHSPAPSKFQTNLLLCGRTSFSTDTGDMDNNIRFRDEHKVPTLRLFFFLSQSHYLFRYLFFLIEV